MAYFHVICGRPRQQSRNNCVGPPASPSYAKTLSPTQPTPTISPKCCSSIVFGLLYYDYTEPETRLPLLNFALPSLLTVTHSYIHTSSRLQLPFFKNHFSFANYDIIWKPQNGKASLKYFLNIVAQLPESFAHINGPLVMPL